MSDILRIISVSGGKDSTALYLWAIDQFGKDGFRAVFADTGHEHPVTLNYVRQLQRMTNGPEVEWVKADFADRLMLRGKEPTGNPFFDLLIWKGRAPSTKAQFCTEHLKLRPIKAWLEGIRGDLEPIMFTGIRAGESANRSKMAPRAWMDLYDCYTERPLIEWSEDQVFEYLRKKGIPPNPLYAAGFVRVGCFPCIHARKSELAALPEWAWEKLEEWESKLGRSWFPAGLVPGIHIPSIADVKHWSKTSYGGRQLDLMAVAEDAKDVPSCMATWGACE